MFYAMLKYVLLGPWLKIAYRPRAEGLENIPKRGPVILAANHLSFMDSLFLPLYLRRKVVFLGKADYFDRRTTRWFVKLLDVIPVRRESGPGAEAALREAVAALSAGRVIGIYPEGTRSPDGRLYRGKSGVARLALATGAPVIPVVIFGTRDLQPPGRRMPALSGHVRVLYGKPLTFARFEGMERDRFALRSVTDEIMYEIMQMSGQEYVDEYASRIKASIAGTALPAESASQSEHEEQRGPHR